MENQNESAFSLNFIDPYWSVLEMDEKMIKGLLRQLKTEMPKDHVLKKRTYQLLARDQRNDDIILQLDDQSIAVVHLTWKQGREISGFPRTRIYPSASAYWAEEMRDEIAEYQRDEMGD